ncbi:unnamed protein product [Echinostoma caproni]|uniref:PH domain-containing protein n=1 Tax=Echinostoma caproni TaxID=27848 RepID=A0A183B9Q5_9TREM|nr:unnamed protein product [Echinostoma caproni]
MIVKIHEGYLVEYKPPPPPPPQTPGPRKADKKRWFVLYLRDTCPYLRYYKHPPRTSKDRPLFDYPLTNQSRVEQYGDGTENRFLFILDQTNQFILQAESRDQMLNWMSNIRIQITPEVGHHFRFTILTRTDLPRRSHTILSMGIEAN